MIDDEFTSGFGLGGRNESSGEIRFWAGFDNDAEN